MKCLINYKIAKLTFTGNIKVLIICNWLYKMLAACHDDVTRWSSVLFQKESFWEWRISFFVEVLSGHALLTKSSSLGVVSPVMRAFNFRRSRRTRDGWFSPRTPYFLLDLIDIKGMIHELFCCWHNSCWCSRRSKKRNMEIMRPSMATKVHDD